MEILRQGSYVDVRIGLSPGELLAAIPEYNALVVRSETRVTSDVIDAGHELAVVGRAGVGVDNIDVDAATRPQPSPSPRRSTPWASSSPWRATFPAPTSP